MTLQKQNPNMKSSAVDDSGSGSESPTASKDTCGSESPTASKDTCGASMTIGVEEERQRLVRLDAMRRNDTLRNAIFRTGDARTTVKKALRAKVVLSGVAEHPWAVRLKRFLRGRYFGALSTLCE